MSTPVQPFILQCPKCGKKYQGDPNQPNARYRCPADQADLVRPEIGLSASGAPNPPSKSTQQMEAPKPPAHSPTQPNIEIPDFMKAQAKGMSATTFDRTLRVEPPKPAKQVPAPPPAQERPQAVETPPPRTTQEIPAPSPHAYDKTVPIEIPAELREKIQASQVSHTTQPIDVPHDLMQRTQPIDIPPGGFQAEEDQVTRMLGSDTEDIKTEELPPPVEDQATRVIGSGGGTGSTPTPPRRTTMAEGTALGPQSDTMTPTMYEQRRSVLAMIESAGGEQSAAVLEKDKYEVVGKLGQGGVGEVLRVMDRDLKREVAMKLLLRQDSDEGLIRFIEEAQATGQLEHPNIVPVHDLGVDGDGRVYFTLKYVQGLSLKKVLKGRAENAVMEDQHGSYYRDAFKSVRMIEILIAVCQAVAYAHSKGIIHRDLKPDNIMLGKYGEVLVMDWGLAKVLNQPAGPHDSHATVRISTSRAEDQSQATMEGSIAGTPAYMAPEQAEGRISELDQRTDIYALGAMLYEVLSGNPPFRGGNALELVRKVVSGPPAPLKGQKGTVGFDPIPRELKAICEKAMARDPHERYATASLLRDDLQAYLENEAVSAAPDTAVQRTVKWMRRNRRQVQTSAVSAAIVLFILVGGYYGWKTWTIQSALSDASKKLNDARATYQSAISSMPKVEDTEPYAGQAQANALGEKNRVFRNGIVAAQEPLRRVLDLDSGNGRGRLLMAESYMEMWRMALKEENVELAKSARREVQRFAPDPSPFTKELNGFGTVAITFDPPETEAALFSFETIRTKGKDGKDDPPRLIPVPYDPAKKQIDTAWLEAEKKRIESGGPLPPERHSIFNLDGTPASKFGKGAVNLAQLAPGSYLLVANAPGHMEVRVPFKMGREGKVERKITLPAEGEAPPLFFFMAGGEVTVGGTTAGAPAPRVMNIPPSYIYHDEITMAEYGAFLKDLARTGHGAEARQRLPKDFGKTLATLSGAGDLVPDYNSDPVAFMKSPVRGVSYNDAMAYIAWRGKQDGYAYRLPKDWEWEAGCRGADARTYSWGNSPGKGLAAVTQGYGDTGGKMSWAWEDYKDESPWGMHNMAGGAAEWTMSKFDPKAKPEDPVFGQLSIRGNAWALPPVGLECDFRTSGQPDYFHPTIGFRMALDYPAKKTGEPTALAAAAHH